MLLKLQHMQDHSCCIFLIPQKSIFYCDSMHQWEASGKKLCSLLSVSIYINTYSLVWYWNTASDISMKELRHFSLFPGGSVWRCLKLGPQLQILLWKLKSGLWLPMSWNGISLLFSVGLHSPMLTVLKRGGMQ